MDSLYVGPWTHMQKIQAFLSEALANNKPWKSEDGTLKNSVSSMDL